MKHTPTAPDMLKEGEVVKQILDKNGVGYFFRHQMSKSVSLEQIET